MAGSLMDAPHPSMARRDLTIINPLGLHARAAARFVEIVASFDAHVDVQRGSHCVSGKSIMGLMMLAASIGTTITVKASGHQAVAVLDALEKLVASHFGEENDNG